MINIIRIVLSKIAFFVVQNNIPAGRNEECTRCGFPPPFDARRGGGRERDRVRREGKKSILLPDRTLPCLLLLACTNNLTLTRHNAALGCIPYTYTYLTSPVSACTFFILSILQDLELPTATTYLSCSNNKHNLTHLPPLSTCFTPFWS